MSITTTTVTVSFRYFMRKTKEWLINHILWLHRILKTEPMNINQMYGLSKHELASYAMQLQNQLPEDEA